MQANLFHISCRAVRKQGDSLPSVSIRRAMTGQLPRDTAVFRHCQTSSTILENTTERSLCDVTVSFERSADAWKFAALEVCEMEVCAPSALSELVLIGRVRFH